MYIAADLKYSIFFSPCCSVDGIDNLINLMRDPHVFSSSLNHLILSCNHPTFACRFLHLFLFVIAIVLPHLASLLRVLDLDLDIDLIFELKKKRGRAEI